MTQQDTTKIQMTETAIAVKATIDPALQQLDRALNNSEGLAKTGINTAIMLVNQVMDTIIEVTNKDFDDYNTLFDQAEALDTKLVKAEEKLKTVDDLVANAELEKVEAQAEAEEAKLRVKALRSELATVKDTLKELQKIDPVSLKKKNISLKQELEARGKILQEQKINIRTLKTENAQLKKESALVTQNSLDLKAQGDAIHEKLLAKDGMNLYQPYQAKKLENLVFYMHYMGYGLTCSPVEDGDQGVALIGDLDWHIMLRTTYCIELTVNFTNWLSPVLPNPTLCPLALELPDNAVQDLHREIYERVQNTHPHLVARVDWAKSVSIADIEAIKDKHLDLLRSGRFISLYDICETKNGRIQERCKGIGAAAEKEIRAVCNKMVSEWERENHNLREVA